MKMKKNIFLMGVWCLFLAFLPLSHAEDISLTAEVNSNKVSLGSYLQLTVTVNGSASIPEIQLPAIDGFDTEYNGPSTRVSIVNGQYFSSKSFTYSLLPQKTGKFTIPPLVTQINGQSYETQPIEVEVVDSSQEAYSSMPGEAVSLKDKISIVLRIPKTEVYLNEGLPVKILLLVRDIAVRDIHYPQIEQAGFTMEDFKDRQYQQIVQGQRVDIVEFDTIIYPNRVGELTIGPVKLDCGLLVQTANASGFNGSLFNDDFFDAFFNRHEKRPITLQSETSTIQVMDLPADGKPQGFSGAVGNFEFEATASPTEVIVGDPVTLKMEINGEGSLRTVEFPEIKDGEKFKVYKPIVKEEEGKKTFEQVVIPKSADVKEIPALSFSYFDVNLNKYRTLTQGPFPITVKPPEEGEQPTVVGMSEPEVTGQPEQLGEDIVFIKTHPGQWRKKGNRLYTSVIFYLFVILAVVVWGVLYWVYRRTIRLATDAVYAKKLHAPRYAKKGLAEAGHYLQSGNKDAFFDRLFKTLQQYLANKLHLPSGAVSMGAIEERLGEDKNKDVIGKIREIIQICDLVRYASGTITPAQMKESYQKLEQIIDYMEREVK